MLAEPGTPHRRGKGKSPGTIMAAFGDRPAAKITTREVSTFLRKLDTEGVSPRSVNKNRQVLSAIFGFACRVDSHGLPSNPVAGATKRREPPAAVLDFYEPEEVEMIASAAAEGLHRGAQPTNLGDDEITWRAREDAQDGELFLGHSRITTTERYMHAKARPEDLERVNLAFACKASMPGRDEPASD